MSLRKAILATQRNASIAQMKNRRADRSILTTALLPNIPEYVFMKHCEQLIIGDVMYKALQPLPWVDFFRKSLHCLKRPHLH